MKREARPTQLNSDVTRIIRVTGINTDYGSKRSHSVLQRNNTIAHPHRAAAEYSAFVCVHTPASSISFAAALFAMAEFHAVCYAEAQCGENHRRLYRCCYRWLSNSHRYRQHRAKRPARGAAAAIDTGRWFAFVRACCESVSPSLVLCHPSALWRSCDLIA